MSVRKAVIPAAGFGTRLYPATKAVKKELFPVVDRDGLVKPFIQLIVQEALSAGMERVCLILQPDDVPVFQSYFQGDLSPDLLEKLSVRSWAREQTEILRDLGRRIDYAVQETQEGFGHAVLCAREWVGDEPFLLLLGDHAYVSDIEKPCALQLVELFERCATSCVGVDRTPGEFVHLYGTLDALSDAKHPREYLIERYVEKPTQDYARSNLRIEGLGNDTFLCLFGQYVLNPDIFICLDQLLKYGGNNQGEAQFTDALQALRDREGGHRALEVQGRRYDIGVPDQYVATLMALAGKK